jgi:hypothetical protein
VSRAAGRPRVFRRRSRKELQAFTGSDPAAPHYGFARRAGKWSSAGLDIRPLPHPPGARRRTRCGRTRVQPRPAARTVALGARDRIGREPRSNSATGLQDVMPPDPTTRGKASSGCCAPAGGRGRSRRNAYRRRKRDADWFWSRPQRLFWCCAHAVMKPQVTAAPMSPISSRSRSARVSILTSSSVATPSFVIRGRIVRISRAT